MHILLQQLSLSVLYSNKYALATSVKSSLSFFLSAFYGQAFHTALLLYKLFHSVDLDRKRSFNYFDEFFTHPVISVACIQSMMLHILCLNTMNRTGAGEPSIKKKKNSQKNEKFREK